MTKLSGTPQCHWIATATDTAYPSLVGDRSVDIAIVGAGIVGLTAALELAADGQSIAVLDGQRVGRQVTGRSSAKITTQHNLIYADLTCRLGEAKARLYAEANMAGVQRIRDWTGRYGIECDLESRAAYTYTCDEGRLDELKQEVETAKRYGLPASFTADLPLPVGAKGAVRFDDQAQFNPAAYLVGIAAAAAAGAAIYENSWATRIEAAENAGRRWRVRTATGAVAADHVLVATNQPFSAPENYNHRTQPRCHPSICLRMDSDKLPNGMFISAEHPTRSIRTARDNDGPLLQVLGPQFRTGQEGDVAARFQELEAWARAHFDVGALVWRWVNEDMDTFDRVPFVGAPKPEEAPGWYVATGFNAWGISNGTAAGLLIADLARGRENPWTALYDPARPFDKDFHKGGESQSMVNSVADIPAGGGGVLKVGEEHVAVFKEEDGRAFAVSAHCTHKGCPVTWNNADRTWDCPCHGSIYRRDGQVIHGPATAPLKPRPLPQ